MDMAAARDGTVTQTHAGSARLARMLVGMMLVVVLSFISVFFIMISRGRAVGREIDGIVWNALPSVEELTAARGHVRRLDTLVRDYADAVSTGTPGPAALEAMPAVRAELDDALKTYFKLPMFPGEQALSSGVPGELADLDRTISAVKQAGQASDVAGSQSARRDEILQAQRLDETLEQLVNLNASQGQDLGLAVEEERAHTRRLAMSLDALAAGLALLATSLAVIAMRRTFRTLEIDRESASRRAWMLGERSAELDQFAGRMAHDVLSPLSSVSLALEFLRRRVGSDARIEATVTRALASLQRVRRIVDGLLEFARAGARPEPGAASDLRAVIEDVLEGALPEAVEERIHLVAEPFATCRVACSPGVLTSLCSNLVHNAIRHMNDTDERKVIVRVTAIDDHRRVEVDDTGPGVPAALASTLFDPFVRAQGHEPGIGLGLATVRRLVQGHGGEVGYRTKPEGGTVFWFELGVAASEEPRSASS
jgi:signal transduction histidine kinase